MQYSLNPILPCPKQLENILASHRSQIESWFQTAFSIYVPPLTCSVDFRNSGCKLTVVDNNLYPAGFNNLTDHFLMLASQAFLKVMEKHYPLCRKILILGESHTRNLYYLENLRTLKEILEKAGFLSEIGILSNNNEPEIIELLNGRVVTLYPVSRLGNFLSLDNFTPDLVLLNNDLMSGIPDVLKDLKIPIEPSITAGWHRRSKYKHFEHYFNLAKELCSLIDLDPWLITPLFEVCDNVDFLNRIGEEDVILKTKNLLTIINRKYKEYGFSEKPFVMIKADAGSYGMGVLRVDDPESIPTLNRKKRTEMMQTKGKKKITRVLIQEGVATSEKSSGYSAETVVYLVNAQVVGGFYRVHAKKSEKDNLNTPGMYFEALTPSFFHSYYSYTVIARLSVLAAAKELKDYQEINESRN